MISSVCAVSIKTGGIYTVAIPPRLLLYKTKYGHTKYGLFILITFDFEELGLESCNADLHTMYIHVFVK